MPSYWLLEHREFSDGPCWREARHLRFPPVPLDWPESDREALSAYYAFIAENVSNADTGDCEILPSGRTSFRYPSKLTPNSTPTLLEHDRTLRYHRFYGAFFRSLKTLKPPKVFEAFRYVSLEESVASAQSMFNQAIWKHVWESASTGATRDLPRVLREAEFPFDGSPSGQVIIDRYDLVPYLIGWFAAKLETDEGRAAILDWYSRTHLI